MTFAHRLLRTCSPAALVAATLAVSAAPAMAGCNSGVGNGTTTFSLATVNCQATGSGFDATAVGDNAQATSAASTALGTGAYALGQNATALGSHTGPFQTVAGATMIGARTGALGAGIYSTAIGAGTNNGTSSTRATGAYSIAIGGGDGANFDPSIGPEIKLNGARATGFISTAIGTASLASGGGSSAFGLYSRASGTDSAAYGELSNAVGASSIAIGLASTATGSNALAAGRQSNAGGTNNNSGTTAIGSYAQAGIGPAGQSYATAVGYQAKANALNSSAFGYASSATGNLSIAIGRSASATQTSSVAIGTGSIANVANTISVGSASIKRRIVNVAPATGPSDAVTLAQLQAATASAQAQPVDDIRRELAALRALVQQQQALLGRQQERIATLESAARVAALTD